MKNNIITSLKDKKVFICLACTILTITTFSIGLTVAAFSNEITTNENNNVVMYDPEVTTEPIMTNVETTDSEETIITTEELIVTTTEPIMTNVEETIEENPVIYNIKSNEEIALEVIQGKWGCGITRKISLTSAGYNYYEIQKIVNDVFKKRITLESLTNKNTNNSYLSEKKEENKNEVKDEEFIVFKERTHYIHRSTCHWYINDKKSCYKINNPDDLSAVVCRKCTECNPNIEIVNYYKPEENNITTNNTPIDDYSRTLLAEIVHHEAGCSWITTYNKAKVAAGVMNRVNDSRFPDTVYDVLTQKGQFTGYKPGCVKPTQDDYDAVDYYFSHINEFNSDNSWWGDGRQNHFYYQ